MRGADSQRAGAELARHFAGAGGPVNLAKACTYARQAAEQAAARFGWEEAARYYELALDCGQRADALGAAGEIELLRVLALALRRSGCEEAARVRCDEALALCRAHGRRDLLVRVAITYAGDVPEWGHLDPAARAVLEEAAHVADTAADAAQARALARLAIDVTFAHEGGALDRVPSLCKRALAAAQRADDLGALADAQAARFYWDTLIGPLQARPPRAVRRRSAVTSGEVIAAAMAAGHLERVVSIRLTRLAAAFAAGQPDVSWRELAAIEHFATSSRVPAALWAADAGRAMRAAVEGQFDDARRCSAHAYRIGKRLQVRNAASVRLSQEIMLYTAQGRLAELTSALTAFTQEHPAVAVWRPFVALAHLAAGEVAAARAGFDLLCADLGVLASPGVSTRFLLAGTAALCIGLRDRKRAALLYPLVERHKGGVWTVDALSTVGPWALLLGSLARLLGLHAEAEAHLRDAITAGQRAHARPVVAHAQSLLAALWLAHRPDSQRREKARALLAEAETAARELGIADVLARVQRLREKARNVSDGTRVAAAANCWHREGEYWTVQYAGATIRLKDSKGMRYLAYLLVAPGRDAHVLDLVAAANGAVPGPFRLNYARSEPPDPRARLEYRARLEELRAELQEAECFADLGRQERLRNEIEELTRELSWRFRRLARGEGPAERARKAVGKAIRTQAHRIAAVHPPLGRHLVSAVRTGTFCTYAPREPTGWTL